MSGRLGFFSHSLPSRHVVFGFSTRGFSSVESMTASVINTPSDPVTIVARVLSIPLRELYAALWRIGVVDIDDATAPSRRGATAAAAVAAAAVPSA
ncbi:Rv1535 domain-containing protein [Mycobacterium sp. ITM-2016-00318]|uniref:Rv1535 domain-containing protein n=1 Tax=Mycobacterium sp. ITM-2016-00318 TaxID=2099693 RepID=UPI00287FEA8B|nr:Rv1535 domain-containing protein [Mycobacterium sp. ITM-2016-00318]WNG93023.1 Rv1535 domain-containing protein [Mycobacterium sp. ITM-2016-00318]